MSEREKKLPDEEGFEALLESSIGELPPDYIAVDVSPWRKAMDRIVLGTALTLVTLNFLRLNYILPAIGTIQLLLGLRRLRRENHAFALCYAMTVIRAVLFCFTLLLGATRFNGEILASYPAMILTAFALIAQFVYILALCRAFRTVHHKAGLSGEVGAALALVIWYVIFTVLALINFSGTIVVLIIIIAYFFIIFKLAKVADELDGAGYSVRCAGVRVSDRAFTLSALGAVAAAGLCLFLLLSSYPMDWQPVYAEQDGRAAQIQTELAVLGYPEELLADLSDEDLLACEGAERVAVMEMHGQRTNGKFSPNTDVIAVKLPGENREWRAFYHFRWVGQNDFRGTEAIDLLPCSGDNGWFVCGQASGRVLCELDGQTRAAPYYSLDTASHTINNFFFGPSTDTHILARFSLPIGGEDNRGYLSYVFELPRGDCIHASAEYFHQKSLWQYPVLTAGDYALSRETGDISQVFERFQNTFSFDSFELYGD